MKHIIFVEDDESIRDIASIIFNNNKYRVTIFSRGEELFEAETVSAPDIFILDKQLPGMDGLDICRKLKAQEDTRHVPVVMLSANPKIKTLAREAGADESIEKPFSIDNLKDLINNLTDGEKMSLTA